MRPEGETSDADLTLGRFGPLVAIDIPSGVEGDPPQPRPGGPRGCDGGVRGVEAGRGLRPGTELAGRLEVADIGFPPGLVQRPALVEPADAGSLPRAAGRPQAFDGVVLVLAGSRDMRGAAGLASAAPTARVPAW